MVLASRRFDPMDEETRLAVTGDLPAARPVTPPSSATPDTTPSDVAYWILRFMGAAEEVDADALCATCRRRQRHHAEIAPGYHLLCSGAVGHAK
jgi:hypothetical protein